MNIRIAAVVAVLLLVSAAPVVAAALESLQRPQMMITRVVDAPEEGKLFIEGTALTNGHTSPTVQLGSQLLELLTVSDTLLVAERPPGLRHGTHRLIVIKGNLQGQRFVDWDIYSGPIGAAGAVFVKAGGQIIGTFLTERPPAVNGEPGDHYVLGLSSKGYLFSIRVVDVSGPGGLPAGGYQFSQEMYFELPGCAGAAHVVIDGEGNNNAGVTAFSARQGYVLGGLPLDPVAAYYIPSGSTLQKGVQIQSRFAGGGPCIDGANTLDAFAVFPNDPAVTGMQDSYDGDITIGRFN